MQKERVYHYIKQAVDQLVEQNKFDTGDEFRLTQRQALHAYAEDLENDKLSLSEKLTGFFEIPTGIGKTALFLSIIGKAHQAAKANGEEMKSVIVVPRNKILNDTRDKDAKKFIPDLLDDIGLHGDGHEDKDMPIMLMTYRAFEKLTKEYELGPENVDLLITDESHRGISENLTENVISAYQDTHTAMLGFTASSEFDDERSVFNTHRRSIYEKKIGQAIREGDQLAEYIQTQNYVIRIEPEDLSKLQEVFDEAVLSETDYKSRMKQAAWNSAMVRVLREGRDERTKEPLTDNQGAFYTQDITHANALEKMLNSDPVLNQRAAAQGYKKVSVAIHSYLSSSERKQAFKDYEDGKIMMIVGADMFKEGFDHPPMKTVFDYQRGSLVDKVQVLGRGARRWFNEKKDRYEGLTFIDSIIYIGSDDEEIDAHREASAKRNAVTARDILNGEAYILSPKEEKKAQQLAKEDLQYKRSKVIFPDNDNIKEYTDLDSLETFGREQDDLRAVRDYSGYEPISKEDKAFLKSEYERTGLKGIAIFNTTAVWPEGMTKEHARDIVNGNHKSAPPLRVEALKATYRAQTDDPLMPISEEDKVFFKSEIDRTGLGGKALFSKTNVWPEGMTQNLADNIVSGRKKDASPLWVEALKATYRAQTDDPLRPISEEDKAFLKAEAERTDLGGVALFGLTNVWPKGMTLSHANNIVYGQQKSAPPLWVEALKATYRAQPKAKPKLKSELISEGDKAFLKAEADRTDLGGVALFKLTDVWPEGMTFSHAGEIVRGVQKNAPSLWIKALKSTYRAQPNAKPKPKFEFISEEDKAFLKSEYERTDLGSVALFKLTEVWPEGMTLSHANNIVYGQQKSAPPLWVEALKATYRAQPKAKPKLKSELISEGDKAFLKAEADRTDLSGISIFKTTKVWPDGMTFRHADNIVRGVKKSAPPLWIEALKSTYRAQPNAKPKPKFEFISEEDKAFLKSESERTGLKGKAVFKTTNVWPAGMTPDQAYQIARGRQKKAPPLWVEALKATYRTQADKTPSNNNQPPPDELAM